MGIWVFFGYYLRPKSWLKTVAAFANSIGGKIIFGISNDKELVGIDSVQTTIEKITDYIDKFITPKIVFKAIPREENGKNIIELDINPGSSTPYYYRNEGTKTAFIRNGSSTIEAPDYVLNELILKGTGKTYDGIVTGYKKSDFSFSILEADFLEKTGTKFTEQDYSDDAVLEALVNAIIHRNYNNLGAEVCMNI